MLLPLSSIKKTYLLKKSETEVFAAIDKMSSDRRFKPGLLTTEFITVSPPSFIIAMEPIIKLRGSGLWGKTEMTVLLEKVQQQTRMTINIKPNWNLGIIVVVIPLYYVIRLIIAHRLAATDYIALLFVIASIYLINLEKKRLLRLFETYLFPDGLVPYLSNSI